jgi:CBS domain-containing protein
MLAVSDLMSCELVTVGETEPLHEVEALLRRHGIRHLPVVRGHKLVGLVTHRDLLSALDRDRARKGGDPLWTSDFMTVDLVTVGPETPLRDAVGLLLERKIGCLPVVDPNDRLLGILTESDLVRYAAAAIEASDRREAGAGYNA